MLCRIHKSITVSAPCLDDVLTDLPLVVSLPDHQGGVWSHVLAEHAFNNKK